MADQVELARRLFARLIDQNLTAGDEVLDLPNLDVRADDLSLRLMQRFGDNPSLDTVLITLDGTAVGVSTRSKVREAAGVAGGAHGAFSDGDRSVLPGRSNRYRAIVFICQHCRTMSVRSYYDPRTVPQCQADKSHGLMGIQR